MTLDARQLAILLFDKGMTYGELSKRAGVNRQTVWLARKGGDCTKTTARKLAAALEVDVAEIIK